MKINKVLLAVCGLACFMGSEVRAQPYEAYFRIIERKITDEYVTEMVDLDMKLVDFINLFLKKRGSASKCVTKNSRGRYSMCSDVNVVADGVPILSTNVMDTRKNLDKTLRELEFDMADIAIFYNI